MVVLVKICQPQYDEHHKIGMTCQPTADLDIALFGENLTQQAKIANAIDRFNTPQKADVLHYATLTNKKLKDHIQQHEVVWHEKERGYKTFNANP